MLWARTGRWTTCATRTLPSTTRTYAVSLDPPQRLPGKKLPRVFKDKKAFQYNWYARLLQNNAQSPILFLQHEDFNAARLQKLRLDIMTAAQRTMPSLSSPNPAPVPTITPPAMPALTVVRTSILGAALRDLPGVNKSTVKKMVKDTKGAFALLTLPTFHPPQLKAILRAMERSVPPKKPKTPEELKQEEAQKNADPVTPGRRMKRVRQIRTPVLKVVGALVEGRVLLPHGVKDVSTLPTLDTLRAQIVGLLSAPASQLAAVVGEASGGRLARALEGLRKGLEEKEQSA